MHSWHLHIKFKRLVLLKDIKLEIVCNASAEFPMRTFKLSNNFIRPSFRRRQAFRLFPVTVVEPSNMLLQQLFT
jgi:hypothetical protein